MKKLISINEWFKFDFRSKEKKTSDEIIDSIINGIKLENPKIDISSTEEEGHNDEWYPGDDDDEFYTYNINTYTFSLDKLVGYDDDTIIVDNCGNITISGHKLKNYSRKKYNTLLDILDKIIKGDNSEDVFNRLKFYK